MDEWKLTPDLLGRVGNLPKKHRALALEVIGEREFAACAASPLYWLDAGRHVTTSEWPNGLPYAFTKDPHILYKCLDCQVEIYADKRVAHLEFSHQVNSPTLLEMGKWFSEMSPIRPFTVMEYMPPIIEAWERSQYLVVEKSRDMMATWLIVALFTWDAMFHPGRQHLFQSQDALKTYELVQRAKILYDYQPKFLKQAVGKVVFGKSNTKSGELFFIDRGSEILGFPQGPDQIRQFHPSGVFTDETAFQVEAAAGFAAIKPAIQAGGKYVGVSSANPGFFQKLCRDTSDE